MESRQTTLRDVARLVGVSVATVSAALNGSGRVAADTRERVSQAASALNYAPNLAARSLHRSRTNVIGVTIGQLSASSFEILKGINSEARRQGRQLLIITTEVDPQDEARRIRDLASGLADGVILITPLGSPESLAQLASLDIPVVLANYRRSGSMLPVVYGENIKASTELTEHLISLGHRRIAFVAGYPWSGQSDERQRGYQIALHRAGLPFDAGIVFEGKFDADSGMRAARTILGMGHEGPTAVFAANDITALGLVQGFQEGGAGVPADYSVVGFDAAPMERMVPELTTVRHPFVEVGAAATHLLGALVDAGADAPDELRHTQLELPSTVKVCGSTAAPRARSTEG